MKKMFKFNRKPKKLLSFEEKIIFNSNSFNGGTKLVICHIRIEHIHYETLDRIDRIVKV